MSKVSVKHKKFKDIIRIFFQYDIEALPVIDNRNKLRGLIFKNDIIDNAGEISFIDKNFTSASADKFINLPDESEFLLFISKIDDHTEFPVINLSGEVIHLWKKKDILNIYYSISKEKQKMGIDKDFIDFEKIINILPLNILIVNNKNIIEYVSDYFLETLDFKREILVNQPINKIFPTISIIRIKDTFYPRSHKLKYQHRDWYYFIFNTDRTGSNKIVYLFTENKNMFESDIANVTIEEQIKPTQIKKGKPLAEIIENQEKELIKKTLKENDWNISESARLLKIPRQTLQYKISKYKII